MVMDAKAWIWVGFRSDDCDLSEVVAKLPESLGDYELQKIECCGGTDGFGIVVFSHDWDFGVVEFDASAIQHKVDKARAVLTQAADECDLDIEVGVWFQKDFS